MKINRSTLPVVLLMASAFALAGCSGSPPQPSPAPRGGTAAPAPRPLPQPAQAPRPAPPQQQQQQQQMPTQYANTANWRDLPLTQGNWTYSADNTGSAVRFGQPGAAPLLVVRCDRTRPAIVMQRPGFGASQVPATITTSSTLRRLTAAPANPAVQNAAIPFEIAFAVRDPLLDAIAFSRGRFMLEMGGAQTLVLPAWSELGRVIEDCR